MPKFLVIGSAIADMVATVEARNAKHAEQIAEIDTPSLCHQCSGDVTIGDIFRVQVVADGGSGEVEYDSDPEVDVDELQRENKRLTKELAAAKRALVANVKGTRKPRKKVA